jgi:hypothetical protein
MPYYKISTKGSDVERIVDAQNPAAAMKHAAEGHFTVSSPLKQAELVPLLIGGTKVEKAGEVVADQAKGDEGQQGAGE